LILQNGSYFELSYSVGKMMVIKQSFVAVLLKHLI